MQASRVSLCIDRFRNGSNCAQSVLSAYADVLGCDEKAAHRMGTGLGAGIGRKQYVCGAVNGGALVLSALYGNEGKDDMQNKEIAMQKVRQYMMDVENEFSTCQCGDIIGVDISTSEGRQHAHETGLFGTVCVSVIKKVCALLEEELEKTHKV
ncbi:MAG: C_GCAxxG_C_C family protein [Chlorobiales bacterium]|nr:C_GCAxxG_C_C family protein [Chlorobiales bacterium]